MKQNESKKEPTLEEQKAKLRAVKVVQGSIMGIFVVIILAWIILGYWRDNVPVFVSTIAMAIAIFAMQNAISSKLKAGVKKREQAAENQVSEGDS